MAEVEQRDAARPEEYVQAERRLHLLHEVAESLKQAQTAVVKSELPELIRQTERQRGLCRQLSSLPRAKECTVAVNCWSELLEQTRQAELELAQLNRVYGALLRRARRTVDVFCRLMSDSGMTYAPPRATVKVEARR